MNFLPFLYSADVDGNNTEFSFKRETMYPLSITGLGLVVKLGVQGLTLLVIMAQLPWQILYRSHLQWLKVQKGQKFIKKLLC